MIDRSDLLREPIAAASVAITRRCSPCHAGDSAIPDSPSDNRGLVPWAEGPLNSLAGPASQRYNPRFRYSRHALYNLSRPPLSLALLAPLSEAAGGYGTCASGGEPVFEQTTDPDYQLILAGTEDARQMLLEMKRFDMPGFTPRAEYLAEMERNGVLAEIDSTNPYKLEEVYWR